MTVLSQPRHPYVDQALVDIAQQTLAPWLIECAPGEAAVVVDPAHRDRARRPEHGHQRQRSAPGLIHHSDRGIQYAARPTQLAFSHLRTLLPISRRLSWLAGESRS